MNLTLPVGKMRINHVYITETTKGSRLVNAESWVKMRLKIRVTVRYIPPSPPRICTTGQLTMPQHRRKLKVYSLDRVKPRISGLEDQRQVTKSKLY